MSKGKGKVHPRIGHEGPEGEQKDSSIPFFNFGNGWDGWSAPRPGRFTSGE